MKVILDIQDSKVSLFLELIKSIDFVKGVTTIKDSENKEAKTRITEALEQIKQHQQGKLKLKSAKDLLDEL